MKKIFSVFLVFCLLLPAFTANDSVTLDAKRYSSSSSLTKSRNNSSLNNLNKKNNYSSSNNSSTKKSYTKSTRSRTKVFGGILGAMFVGSLIFGNNVLLSTLTTILFWVFIFSLIMRFLRPKRNAQTYEQNNQASNDQYESHHMQQMRYINELVDMANAKDIDVSYILDDDNLNLDEKIKLIRERVN